jgi:ribonuclease BN (tRNA processing enzyme)
MKLLTVGVCGSVPGPDSAASCYLLSVTADEVAACVASGAVPADTEIRDWHIVMELGNGAMGPLSKFIDADKIDALLISHLHADHFADMAALYVHLKHHPVYGSAVTGHGTGIQVWGPEGIDERARRVTIDLSKDMTVLQANYWVDGQTIHVGPFTINVQLVYHVVDCFGMRITAPSSQNLGEMTVLSFTGDTDYCESVVELSRDCNLLLAEAAYVAGQNNMPGLHMSGAQAGQIAREAGAKELVLTHVPPWNDPQVALAEAVTEYSGAVALAVPGGEFLI